jgi:hypothetical protein
VPKLPPAADVRLEDTTAAASAVPVNVPAAAATVHGLPSVQDAPFTVAVGLASAEFGIALATTATDGVVVALVTVGVSQPGHAPTATLVTVPVPASELHPNPTPGVHISPFVAPSHVGNGSPVGVTPVVSVPSTVFPVCVASAEFGIALATTLRLGVVVEFITVGVSQLGHPATVKLVTVPPLAIVHVPPIRHATLLIVTVVCAELATVGAPAPFR